MKTIEVRKLCLVYIIGLLVCPLSFSQTFVNGNAKGLNDGTSWDNAYYNLQDALNAANEGDQIWIATGIYLPGKAGDPRSSSFRLTKGIELYGGFEGIESDLSERDPSSFPTILSGDINQDDIANDFESNRSDNVQTIMHVANPTETRPVIDGISFKNGYADGNDDLLEASNGGGLFLFGPALVRNCSFSQNFSAEGGGALFLIDSLGVDNSGLQIEDCQFNQNQSTFGGAINLNLNSGKVGSVLIRNSNFSENASGEVGGGFDISSYNFGVNIKIDSCEFSNNITGTVGGAVSYQIFGEDNIVTSQNSTFTENRSGLTAGALFMYGKRGSLNNQFFVDNCEFTKNATTESGTPYIEGGGAIYAPMAGDKNYTSIQNSTFSNNHSPGFGGAIGVRAKEEAKNLRTRIISCQFEDNTSDTGGGLFYSSESTIDSLVTRNCRFTGNSVSEFSPKLITRGGAVHLFYFPGAYESKSIIDSCSFENNVARKGDGGALAISPYGKSCFVNVSASAFSTNKANEVGGAVFYDGTDAGYALENCTFGENQANEDGAHFYQPYPFGKRQFYIFFHAVLWFQIMYSLLLFLIVRERTTLYYAIMLFGISLFFALVFDLVHFPFFKEVSGSVLAVLYQMGVFLCIFGLVKFAQRYLNINQLVPIYKKIVFYFLCVFLFFELVFYAHQFELLGQLGESTENMVSFGLMLCFFLGGVMPTIWTIIALRKGYQPAKYFLLAMLFSGAALSWLVVTFFQTGSILTIPIISIEVLLLLSIITLALADGYRVNALKKEKERAERLSELDLAKTRLYTNITHEFRTPLTVIMGASDQVKGNDQEKELIKRNSHQLLQLINQMLDLSKLEGGALKLNPKQGNIIPFIEYLVESFQSMADSKHIRLTFYKETEEILMDFDALRMQQIIFNLVSNAVKFTEASGKVVVHAKEASIKGKPHLNLVVRDNGAGIPAEDLPNIFDRFFQADASDMRRSEGSGIGLALVKELVQLMKGTIEVSSEVDEGTVFTVQIPITKKASIQTQTIKESELLLPVDEASDQETVTSFKPLDDDLPLALIIEDNKDIVSFLRSCLQRKYKIEVAYNGQEGIDKALDIVPDIIISDVMMPEADGYTVCKTLKTDERTSHVPIILLTAKATQEDKVQGLEVGADAYLSKPFHQEELEVRLQKLIELRQQLQERYQGSSIGNKSPQNKEDEFIQKLQSVILDRIEDEGFGINDLCHAVGLSRMQVHRKLKALTGMPATAFINTVRLQKAFELLSDTELNVSEVAYKVGFSNHSYFSKLFVNKYGKTPSEISGR
ncbi:MAG: ATP-binding protein [Bacteroidota bacterium]